MRKKKSRKANEPNKNKTTDNSNSSLPQFNQKINQRNFRAASIFMPRRPK
ncbi:hypothetical protein GW927_04340 [Candidatus Pacearchaeota archaeon]|nr:hypothetical protein [Candidatus Pacearchaeota archaeon]